MPLKCLHTEWNLFKQISVLAFREHVTNYHQIIINSLIIEINNNYVMIYSKENTLLECNIIFTFY